MAAPAASADPAAKLGQGLDNPQAFLAALMASQFGPHPRNPNKAPSKPTTGGGAVKRGRGRPPLGPVADAKGRRYFCIYGSCEYLCKTRTRLIEHARTHFDARPFICAVCGKCFKTKASWGIHRNVHTGVKRAKCRHCPKRFGTAGDRLRHERYVHTRYRPHECDLCGARFVEANKLLKHGLVHTGEKNIQCEHCTYSCVDKFKLIRHMMVHTGEKPFQCKYCQRGFSQKAAMLGHIEAKHMGANRTWFKCDECGKKLGRKTDIPKHKQFSHGYHVCNCKICGEVFRDRYSLKFHKKTVHADHRFRCALCSYQAKTKACMLAHAAKHNRERRFECEEEGCGERFPYRAQLARHRKDVHLASRARQLLDRMGKDLEDFKSGSVLRCPECPRVFRYEAGFNKHVIGHMSGVHVATIAPKPSADKKFKCEACGKGFDRPKWFFRHVKDEHGGKGGLEQIRHLDEMQEEEGRKQGLECMVCGKVFVRPKCLENHVARHSQNGEEEQRTDEATKYVIKCQTKSLRYEAVRFAPAKKRASRKRRKKVNKTFKCSVCGQRFHRARLLSRHMKEHDEEEEEDNDEEAVVVPAVPEDETADGELTLMREMEEVLPQISEPPSPVESFEVAPADISQIFDTMGHLRREIVVPVRGADENNNSGSSAYTSDSMGRKEALSVMLEFIDESGAPAVTGEHDMSDILVKETSATETADIDVLPSNKEEVSMAFNPFDFGFRILEEEPEASTLPEERRPTGMNCYDEEMEEDFSLFPTTF